MKRIAVPVVNGKLSEYFGRCNHYEIFDIDGNQINQSRIEMLTGIPTEDLPVWTSTQGITDVIVHKLDKQIINQFLDKKINLFVGVDVDTPQNLIEEYLSGKLTSNNNIINELTN